MPINVNYYFIQDDPYKMTCPAILIFCLPVRSHKTMPLNYWFYCVFLTILLPWLDLIAARPSGKKQDEVDYFLAVAR